MTDIEKIVRIIENCSPELAAEEILRLFTVCDCGSKGEYSNKFKKVLCDQCFDKLL